MRPVDRRCLLACLLLLAPVSAATLLRPAHARAEPPPPAPVFPPPAAPPQPAPPPAGPEPAPSDAVWQRYRPLATVLLTGRQAGQLRPSGSSAPALGGLQRLAAVVDALQARADGALLSLSLGGVMPAPTRFPAAEAQARLKARLAREAFRELGFGGSLLGANDLYVPDFVMPFGGGGPGDAQEDELARPRLPMNVMPSRLSGADPEASGQPWIELRLRAIPLRILSLVDEAQGEALKAAGLAEQVIAPANALQGLQPNPDVLWIVALEGGASTLASARAALRGLGPSVIVDMSGASGGGARSKVPLGREPLVVSFDEKGRQVGVLDLDSDPDGKGWLASYNAQPLGPAFGALPSPSRGKLEALLEVYRAEVRAARLLDLVERRREEPGSAAFVGSAACARCHEGIYQDWRATLHAQALRTLRREQSAHDPECLPCHVQGPTRLPDGRFTWPASGFTDPDESAHLGGVGCESCHGPGSLHVEEPRSRALFAPGGPNRRQPGREGCMSCHDIENSAGFAEAYATRLERVDHRSVPRDRRTHAPR